MGGNGRVEGLVCRKIMDGKVGVIIYLMSLLSKINQNGPFLDK